MNLDAEFCTVSLVVDGQSAGDVANRSNMGSRSAICCAQSNALGATERNPPNCARLEPSLRSPQSCATRSRS
jgi:hypothetical protein